MKNKSTINKILVVIMFICSLFYFYKSDELDKKFENVDSNFTNIDQKINIQEDK